MPNAFPYFITIERLVSNEVELNTGLLIILGYTLIYCLPCLILLLIGTLSRAATKIWLEQLVQKFGSGTVKPSAPIAVLTFAAGIAVASIPFTWL